LKIVHQVLDGRVAGGQLVALDLARAATRAGHEVAFVAPSEGEFLDLVRGEGMQTVVLPLRRSYRLDDAFGLAGALKDLGGDLLHTHGHLVGNVLGRLAGRVAGVPVVSHMHAENHFRPGRAGRSLQQRYDNATARLCARILAVSDATRRALETQGYPRGRIEVVPNGVDLRRNDPGGIRAELGVPATAPLLVQVGRLCETKGQRELLAALALLPDDVHAVLVGDDLESGGAFRRLLEEQVESSGLGGRVVLAGYRPDARAIVAAADVFVLPSWLEGQPLVVLEAMAEATPVVATAVGGTPELVADGETGLLVPPRRPEALADALRDLLADRDRARRLGEAGRQRVMERFSAERVARRVLAIYAEVAS
jgi:glycosyltransferase involved in cell wall biosynthesis